MTACIWYVSKYVALPSARKGSARAFLLLREMAALGHRCVILTSDANHLTTPPHVEGRVYSETVEGVDVHWVSTLKFAGASSVRRVLSWIDFEWRLWRLPKASLPRPDTVIVSSPSLLTIFNGLLLRRRYGCRLIFEVRDIWPLTLIEEGGYSPFNPFVIGFRAVELLAYRFADEIVGTMPNLEQHVAESLDRHPPVSCIPFGVHADMIEQAQPLPIDWIELHIPKGKYVVCYAGSLGISNAMDTLFACARDMLDHPDVHFLIVGEGGLKPHYDALYGCLDNVSIAGSVPKDVVPSVLALCDLLYFSVHTSKVWAYGLSLNKVIDYMLAAKPIIASYTGYPTMVDEARAGVSAPAGDPAALKREILHLRAQPRSQLVEMGERGHRWAWDNLNYRKLADDYLRIALRTDTPKSQRRTAGSPPPEAIRPQC